MTRQSLLSSLIFTLLTLLFTPILALAHGGEDHGDGAKPVSAANIAPRAEAQTELFELVATPGNGSYRVNAPQFAKPGSYPLLFTVEAGTDTDLIETTLVVPEAAKPEAAVHLPASGSMWWWVGGGLAALAGISLLLKRRRPSQSA